MRQRKSFIKADFGMICLHRIEPARNMCRFYSLDIQPDLFGGFLLMKRWGHIGSFAQIRAERYHDEALATAAMQRQAKRKRRRGYAEELDRTKEGLTQDEVERIRL
jgi:predicted DNA-binding WGR domain protein